MSDRIGSLVTKRRTHVAAALLAIMAAVDPAWPQAATQSAPSAQAQPATDAPTQAAPQQGETAPPPEAPKENPGLINEIGKLLPTLKSPKETLDDAANALARLTKSPGVKGRMICPVAANGAPDCKAAADKLCQSKGFKEGKSLDVDTTRNCSAKALLSGRKPEESECRTDNYVTRALCQ